MPTYEYRCKSCDHGFEIVQAFTDDPVTTCPECAGPVRKVYGSVGISFKGEGFYKNDSRGGRSSSRTAESSAGNGSSGSSGSSDSTTKTADSSSSGTKAGSSSGGSSGSSGSSSSTSD